MFFRKKKIDVKTPDIDIDLLNRIAPEGGVTTQDEKYISTGNAYISCISVYAFPSGLNRHWLSKLCNIKNTIVTIDVATDNKNEVIKNVNRSIEEHSERRDRANTHAEYVESQNKVLELQKFYDEISKYDKVSKLIRVRIFVANRNLYLVQEQVDEIITKLQVDKFKCAVFLNETENDFRSLLESYTAQNEKPYTMPGQEVTATTIAGGNPFHFSSLDDPYGIYTGNTPCGGSVIFDLFDRSDDRRLYYNALVWGNMRVGKSSFLKKQFSQRAMLGDFVRAFDVVGDFVPLTEYYGGKIIACDGTGGIQNPFEILKSADSDNGSFARHISKLSTWYKFLVPEATSDQITLYTNLLHDFYRQRNLLPEKGKSITEYPAEYYPIMEDFYHYILKQMDDIKTRKYKGVEEQEKAHELLEYKKIADKFKSLITTYGHIFNGHTSFSNLKDVQIVTYDMSKLKEMESSVFDAQLFNILSTCWDNCVTNGTVMKQLYEENKIAWEDIVHFLIIIDESHRWVNINKLYAVDLLTKYMREAPKFFGGILLASQSIRDYVPEAKGTNVDELKKLFELTQYKFIFRQDYDTLPLMKEVFGNALTPAQFQRIPKLAQGEVILSISGFRNLEFKVHLSDREKALFKGGV